VKLTHASPTVAQDDIDRLRAHGWSDEAISDAIQVIAYFNYINRVADGVGVDNEPDWA
jgi:alkylhydroperoxidase family enzyme